MPFIDTIPGDNTLASNPNNKNIKPISAGQAKIRIGPISGTKIPYPLPRRFPHVTPNPISAFDGSVPDKLPFTKALDQATSITPSGNPILNRQWRFLVKESYISKTLDQSIPGSTQVNVSTRGINISLGLNQAIKIRRYNAWVYDKANSQQCVIGSRGLIVFNLNDLPTSPSGDIPAKTPFIISNIQSFAQITGGSPMPVQGPDSLHAPAIISGDSIYQKDDWHEYDDYADFFSSANRGLVDITITYLGQWQVKNTIAGAVTLTSQESILYELYELVT